MKYYGKIEDPKDLITKEYVDYKDIENKQMILDESVSRDEADSKLKKAIIEESITRNEADKALGTQIDTLNNNKQDTLTAGENITIDENNIISADIADVVTYLSTSPENTNTIWAQEYFEPEAIEGNVNLEGIYSYTQDDNNLIIE